MNMVDYYICNNSETEECYKRNQYCGFGRPHQHSDFDTKYSTQGWECDVIQKMVRCIPYPLCEKIILPKELFEI